MKQIGFVLLGVVSGLMSCQSGPNSEANAVLKTDSQDLIGHTFEFNYPALAIVYHIKILSDSTLHWKLIAGTYPGAKEGTDKYIHSQLNEDVLYLSWVEKSGLGLYNVLDLKRGSLTTHGEEDGQLFINPGKVKRVD